MKFRSARHTVKLLLVEKFYTEILNLKLLGSFENHDGYNGIFLGRTDEQWHLEFTNNGEVPQSAGDDDDLLVFYPETTVDYDSIVRNIEKYNIQICIPKNPYWKNNGIFIKDPDGFGIIIAKEKTF